MKKIVSPLLVIAALAAVAAFFIHRAAPARPRAAELVPATSVVFAQLPDIHGTMQRFSTTELSKLGEEPEVKAFLERPMAKAPQSSELQLHLARLARVDPREAFIAVTTFTGSTPQMVGGFAFNGSRKAVHELIDPARAEIQKMHPASRIDVVVYGASEIELLTDKEFTIAQAIRKDWCLIATDLALLQHTLDRLDGKNVEGESLAASALFRDATVPLPATREGLFYAELSELTKRLADLMAATGQPVAKEIEALKRFRAITATTSIDGGRFRDTWFILAPGSTPEPPLARNSLALSSPETLLYYSAALPAQFEIPEPTRAALTMMAPPFAAADKALSGHNLQWADLGTAFGPEFGLLLEWPAQSLQPVMVISLDVRDREKARTFIEALTAASGDTPAWTRQQENGIDIYRMTQPQPVAITSPSLAFNDRFLLISATRDAALTAMQRLEAKQGGLGTTSAFINAQQSVVPPTTAYGYFNLQSLFERAYGTFRPFIAMSLAFMPNAAEYIDASKLPSTEVVSRHLGQITYSQAQTAQGILSQSTGTVTLNQALLGMVAGSIGASLPALTNPQPGQALDLSKLFGIPGLPIGPSAPAQPSPTEADKTPTTPPARNAESTPPLEKEPPSEPSPTPVAPTARPPNPPKPVEPSAPREP
jgi:hypothetical protein